MTQLDNDDTIAAVASPGGPALRGLVRVTGPDAWTVALGEFEPERGDARPDRPEVRRGRLRVEGLRTLLPATVALWPGPRDIHG